MSLLAALAVAALAGASLSAVAGLGGGTLLIGTMFTVGLAPALAIPLHAAVQLASNGSRAVAYWPHVHWPSVAWFSLASLPLPFVTAHWVAQANPDLIRLLLAAAIIYSISPFKPRLKAPWSMRGKMLGGGVLNGFFGPVVGASGPLIAPFFLDARWSKETTVGTLAACQCVGHAIKVVAFGTVGLNVFDHWDLALPLMLAVAAGTWLGRQLMSRISREQFVRVFHLVLVLLVLRLAWVGASGLLLA